MKRWLADAREVALDLLLGTGVALVVVLILSALVPAIAHIVADLVTGGW